MVFRMSQEKIIDMLLNQIRNNYFESEKDQDIPDNVIVFGQSPNLIFKENKYNG